MFITLQRAFEKPIVAIEVSKSLPKSGKTQHKVCQACRDRKLKCSGFTAQGCVRCKAQCLECCRGKSSLDSSNSKRKRQALVDERKEDDAALNQSKHPLLLPSINGSIDAHISMTTPRSMSDSFPTPPQTMTAEFSAQTKSLNSGQGCLDLAQSRGHQQAHESINSGSAMERTWSAVPSPQGTRFDDIPGFDFGIDDFDPFGGDTNVVAAMQPDMHPDSTMISPQSAVDKNIHDDDNDDNGHSCSENRSDFSGHFPSMICEDDDLFSQHFHCTSSAAEPPTTDKVAVESPCHCTDSALLLLEKVRFQENTLPSACDGSSAAMQHLYCFKRFVLHFQDLVACPHCSCTSRFMTLMMLLSEQLTSKLHLALDTAATSDGSHEKSEGLTNSTVIGSAYLVDLPTERRILFISLAFLHVTLFIKAIVALHSRALEAQWKNLVVSLRKQRDRLQAMESTLKIDLSNDCAMQSSGIQEPLYRYHADD